MCNAKIDTHGNTHTEERDRERGGSKGERKKATHRFVFNAQHPKINISGFVVSDKYTNGNLPGQTYILRYVP